jgi:2-dehydropantoate 2-reductase
MNSSKPSTPSIAIVGAGAVGGYYGGRLAQHGHDVHFLLRSDYPAWKAQGLRVQSIDGDFTLPARNLRVYSEAQHMPKVDLVIITLKTTENHQIAQLVRPLLHDETAILTLQNGLGNEQLLADLFGTQRVLGGMAFTCLNRVSPGVIQHTDHGFIRLGEFCGPTGRSERAIRIADLLAQSMIHASAIEDLRGGRWDKQVWNVPFNGLGALLDASTDRLIGDEDGTRLVRAIMEEVLEAARADGVELSADSPLKKIESTRTMGAYQSSTQIDRRLGRPMEIEAIFGQPVEIARRACKTLPLLEMLYFCLRQLDRTAARPADRPAEPLVKNSPD